MLSSPASALNSWGGTAAAVYSRLLVLPTLVGGWHGLHMLPADLPGLNCLKGQQTLHAVHLQLPALLPADPPGKRKERLMEIFGDWSHHGRRAGFNSSCNTWFCMQMGLQALVCASLTPALPQKPSLCFVLHYGTARCKPAWMLLLPPQSPTC